MQLPQPINYCNNIDFTNQRLNTRDNIVSWTNKDKKKRQTIRMQAVKHIETVNAKTQIKKRQLAGIKEK